VTELTTADLGAASDGTAWKGTWAGVDVDHALPGARLASAQVTSSARIRRRARDTRAPQSDHHG
jgi:hypothetical protein